MGDDHNTRCAIRGGGKVPVGAQVESTRAAEVAWLALDPGVNHQVRIS